MSIHLSVLTLETLDLVLVVGDLPLHVSDVLSSLLENLGSTSLVSSQRRNTILETTNQRLAFFCTNQS